MVVCSWVAETGIVTYEMYMQRLEANVGSRHM